MMTNEQKCEIISAFLDGESIDETMVGEFLADEEIMKKWDEYTNIRATLRGELPTPNIDLTNFADKVSKAIEKEPIYITTNAELIAANDDVAVTKNEAKNNALKRFSGFMRSFGQIAIAASVACICVFGVQMYKNLNDVSPTNFHEQSYMNANGIGMATVSNTAKSIPTMSLDNTNVATVTNDNYAMNTEQLRKLEKQKAKELKTIDALINDHDMMKRTMIINN